MVLLPLTARSAPSSVLESILSTFVPRPDTAPDPQTATAATASTPPVVYAQLDAARWIAALAVVMLHTAAQALGGTAEYGSASWMAANVYDSAVRWSVPVFVMISGALMLDTRRDEGLTRFYGKRMGRVLAPLLFWTLFYLVWRRVMAGWDGAEVDYAAWLMTILDGKPYYHLWYLYMLVGLYLCAPFVRNLYARTRPRARVACVALILGIAVLDGLYRQMTETSSGFFLTWCLPYLGYFLAGRLIFEGTLRLPAAGVMLGASIAATALGAWGLSNSGEFHGYFYDYFSLTVPFMSLAVFQLIHDAPALPRLPWLVPLTFGIYLVHPAVLDVLSRSGLYAFDTHTAAMLPMVCATVFIVSALITRLMQRNTLTARLV